jgi:hypothetical protein
VRIETQLYIPVTVVVDRYFYQRPDAGADNPDDYYGYTDIEWHLEDSDGNKLTNIERLLSKKDIGFINDEIEESIKVEVLSAQMDQAEVRSMFDD